MKLSGRIIKLETRLATIEKLIYLILASAFYQVGNDIFPLVMAFMG